ncbi:murein biosynthesis integral membrane protein MurJ [Thermosynechococcus sp. GLH187]|uniref:murein biosynthesis integral membrane protein MurJ n=1 Tax=unclassified Thermosynechococcus TaxID=2622553 RepID=UPI002877B430|nr:MULTISPECIES: murein biosynthesis integral membrane protein MurJ [unclassified Thermosynechococcus]WNC44727.1 murein biosynthesis integral membrane protein MurJ [Thermosynechococcus sp. GLH187]WNC47263.1 murein biosynthesis integral membrane protein MurJ [Thermosynechococcus sp. GLH333]WNC49800.1 murein biosynthesis integral membrane protein MurJ [Thermosynechococcus sp. GLH87]
MEKKSRSLAHVATIVAVATLLSKVAGLVRQQAIAAEFGVGAAVDAYSYAYVIPGFLFVLLGGINGPFHSSIISVVLKQPPEKAAPLVETITTVVGALLLVLTAILIVLADPLIQLIAPGASPEIQALAAEQFRIMAPLAVLSGLIGIGFGTLNAADQYWLPSMSPLLSSLAVIIGIWFFADQFGPAVLAWGTLAGGVLQWLVQIPAQWQAGMGTLRLRFDLNRPEVRELIQLMGPATLSSGMLLISVYISLFFASQLPVGAASALSYSQLLFLTPLGILSNVILVPYMPIFSKLAQPEHWPDLKERIRQSLVLTALSMMPLGGMMAALALPAVRVVYERRAFDFQASQLVAALLLVYAIGMFFYLARDVIVRVFYALEDGRTPLYITLWGLGFNALFCFFFTQAFGAVGLAMATVGVNTVSFIALTWILHRRLGGLPWGELIVPLVGIALASVLSGGAGWGALKGLELLWGREGLGVQLLQLAIAGSVSLIVFAAAISPLNLPELEFFLSKVRRFLPKRYQS